MFGFFEFPNDENGKVLRQMKRNGDNLSIARNIDFTIVFPDENAAKTFAAHFQELNHEVSIENSNCVAELPWDVLVVKNMVPIHSAITDFENLLQNLAEKHGGRNDGWGCFNQKEP
ncbi:ribonuclease E inhibitor RraB [Undibacterium sp. Ji22W]|uniref:ribonuclease E inhibitor RraB n=1 Tax=Undibacterium sp. Ji22W TaxID=3413038 RepID=UPI003BF26FE6